MPRSAPDPKPVPRTTRPHDALFKAAFEQPEHAAALLRESFDAPIREAIDWQTLAVLPEAEPIFMTIAEQYIQEGLEKGLEKLRATLRKQLTRKFGAPSPEVDARIAAASEEELDRYFERVVSAPDLAAVFAP